MHNPAVLLVLDGIAINDSEYGNAVKMAYTPTLDELQKQRLHIL